MSAHGIRPRVQSATRRPTSAPGARRSHGASDSRAAASSHRHGKDGGPNVAGQSVNRPGSAPRTSKRPSSAPIRRDWIERRRVGEVVLPEAGLPASHVSYFGAPLNSMSDTVGLRKDSLAPQDEKERLRQARREMKGLNARGTKGEIWGTDTWSATSQEYGSLTQCLQSEPRKAFPAFVNSMFLAHHPHWKTKPEADAKSWRSTYADLGSYYTSKGRLPGDFLAA